jgi:hypothetical protein
VPLSFVYCVTDDIQEAAAKLAEEKRLAEAEAARIKAEQQKQKEEEVTKITSSQLSTYISPSANL